MSDVLNYSPDELPEEGLEEEYLVDRRSIGCYQPFTPGMENTPLHRLSAEFVFLNHSILLRYSGLTHDPLCEWWEINRSYVENPYSITLPYRVMNTDHDDDYLLVLVRKEDFRSCHLFLNSVVTYNPRTGRACRSRVQSFTVADPVGALLRSPGRIDIFFYTVECTDGTVYLKQDRVGSRPRLVKSKSCSDEFKKIAKSLRRGESFQGDPVL